MSEVDSMGIEIAKRLEESAQIKKAIAMSMIDKIESMVTLIVTAYKAREGSLIW